MTRGGLQLLLHNNRGSGMGGAENVLRPLREFGVVSAKRWYSVGLMKNSRPESRASIYVHWPYCKSICPYCDFNRYLVTPNSDQTKMGKALLKELDSTIRNHYRHLESPRGLEITSVHAV